jgi:hypothetical protein
VFYDFGKILKLIINGVKLLTRIAFFIKVIFYDLLLLLENVRPNKLRPENSDPLKIKTKKTENHNLEPFQLLTGHLGTGLAKKNIFLFFFI